MRQAREQELKCLRDLGVFEKVDEREARVQYQVTPVDTKLIDTSKAFDGEAFANQITTVAREFKSGDRPDLYRRDFSVGSVQGNNIHRRASQSHMLTHAHRRATCIFSRECSEICAGKNTSGGQEGADAGKLDY